MYKKTYSITIHNKNPMYPFWILKSISRKKILRISSTILLRLIHSSFIKIYYFEIWDFVCGVCIQSVNLGTWFFYFSTSSQNRICTKRFSRRKTNWPTSKLCQCHPIQFWNGWIQIQVCWINFKIFWKTLFIELHKV